MTGAFVKIQTCICVQRTFTHWFQMVLLVLAENSRGVVIGALSSPILLSLFSCLVPNRSGRACNAVFVCSRKCLLTVRFVMKVFSKFHTPACCGFTFSGALAPQPPRQVESRKMQRLLPETAMKELHSQAPGGKRVKRLENIWIIWHLVVLEV